MDEKTEQLERKAFSLGLRELADLVENSEVSLVPASPEIILWAFSAEEFAAKVRAIPGKLAKRTWGGGTNTGTHTHMEVSRKFGSLRLSVNASRRRVCTPRVVGTEKVKVEEVITPAVTQTKEIERDVISWDCEPLLGRARSAE